MNFDMTSSGRQNPRGGKIDGKINILNEKFWFSGIKSFK
jgi:hypothetical protein